MNAIAAKQSLWRSEEDFETEPLVNQYIHACSFKTVQKQKSAILI